jgi:hypothetical protein
MKGSPLEHLRSSYLRRRHTSLLAAIVCAIAVRPLISDVGIGPLVFSLSMLGLLLVALFAIQVDELAGERTVLLAQRRLSTLIAWVLAALAAAERLYVIFAPSPETLLLGTLAWLLFLAFVTGSLLRHLLRHKEITGETISMSISIYLLLGFSWALLYAVILEFQPDAFRFGDTALVASVQTEIHILPILIYFSLTTLSTIGFGDITPVSLLARYAAVAEGITGQLYLAILVARLVGMHLSRRSGESGRPDPH